MANRCPSDGLFALLVFIARAFCKDDLGNVSFWPANGAIVVALLILPSRLGGIVTAACLVINIIGNELAGYPPDLNVIYSLLNIFLSLVAAMMVRRFCGAATDLSRFRRFAVFFLAVIAAAAVEATIGEGIIGVTAGFRSVLNEWTQWVFSDSLGLLISVPAILLGLKNYRYRFSYDAGPLERGLLFLLTGAVATVAFSVEGSPLILFIYPMVVLVAFRAGPAWVLATVMGVSMIASSFTVHGMGPMAVVAGKDLVARQELLQPFLASLFICALPANNALGERSRTARRLARLNVKARLARAEAISANAAKSQFIANISHEIRTPLNGVLGMAQAMSADDLSPVQRGRLGVIRQSGEGLLTILNDVLDISKIEAGLLDLEEIEFDLPDVLASTHGVFTALAQEKGLQYTLEIDDEVAGAFRGDPTRLRQVVYNLISNAVKFTQTGGVRVSARLEDGLVQVSVADTGIGIPQAHLQKLFQRFMQADPSTTRKFGGTGLGLAISNHLTQLMGGAIEVESIEGRGSVFTVRLPLHRVSEAPATVSSGSNPGQAALLDRPIRVLAAEDNTVNQLVLKTLLEQFGIDPVVVGNGELAVASWEEQGWDLILMDIQMPVMDGQTATRIIRERERATGRARTPIIALTANAMSHQVAGYQNLGMDGFISKPIEIGKLHAAIISALEPMVADEAPPRAREG